jgi:hypothetical protein
MFNKNEVREMRSVFLLLFSMTLLLSACGGKQDGADDTQAAQHAMTEHGTHAGTTAGTLSGEVIGNDMGYIVEQARLGGDPSTAAFTIKNLVSISKGTNCVLIIRTETEGGATEWLALEFPAFAEGTRMDYAAGEENAGFWIFGIKGEQKVMKQTGSVEGMIRLVKKSPSSTTLGLNRELLEGVGEMEIVVKGIEPEGLDVYSDKKYAARFTLPMITLDELARINQPI